MARRRDGEWLIRGKRRIGDEAVQEYEGGDGWYGSTVTFRSADLNSYVEFEGHR